MDDWQTIQFLVEKVQELESQLQNGASVMEWELEKVRDRLATELRPKVHQMVQCIVRDRELVEDIVQIALFQILRRLGNYDRCHGTPFRSWMARVVIRIVYR
ncbi:MAG: sigma factor, partial [Armatimonadota bacterium]